MSDTTSASSQRGEPSEQDTSTATNTDTDRLAAELSSLARVLEQVDDADAVLSQIVQAAIAMIPGAEEGSISVVTGRKDMGSQAPSSQLPIDVDAIQSDTGQGPCMDAVFDQRTVRVPDLTTEDRWPEFIARAVQTGTASMLSFQLWVEGDNLGALNLYARTPNAFTDESEHIGLLFAAHAAIAYAGVAKMDHLQHALTNRDLIGQAKGILIERHKITGQRAFELLVGVSSRTNTKLSAVADHLVHQGQLPTPD